MVAKKTVGKATKGATTKRAAKETAPKNANAPAKSAGRKSAATTPPSADFPKGVSQPATRALASIGVTKVSQLAKHREADVAALHGMGPKALGILKTELEASGKSFRK